MLGMGSIDRFWGRGANSDSLTKEHLLPSNRGLQAFMIYDEKLKSTRPLAVPFWDRLASMKWFTFVIVTLTNLGVVV